MIDSERKYGILIKDLNNILDIVSRNIKVESVVLFGSRAKGNYENGSDMDIALKGEAISFNDILEISADIEDLWLPYRIDIVSYDMIDEIELRHHIDRVGISLYNRE